MQIIEPVGQTLIVEPLKGQETELDSGIVVSDIQLQRGKVRAVSDELKDKYELGDTVIFPENSGITVQHEGKSCLWIKPMILDYIGIVTDKPKPQDKGDNL